MWVSPFNFIIDEVIQDFKGKEVAMMLELLGGVKTGLNLHRIADVCSLVENISHRPIPLNKPIGGRELSYLETGIVVDLG